MSEKTYINGLFIKKRATQFGDVVNVSINVDKLIEDLKAHKNERGYVNISLMNRKEEDKNGNNMYAILDTYKGGANKDDNDENLPF